MKCSVNGCDREQRNNEKYPTLCHAHYVYWARTGKKPVHPVGHLAMKNDGPCKHPDCDNNAYCRGWCNKHYTRVKKHGDPDIVKRPHEDVRPVTIEGKLCIITLSDGSEAICDKQDYDLVAARNWAPAGIRGVYVATNILISKKPIKYRTGYLHRMIVKQYQEIHPKDQIDHINGDPRDNRRKNLRTVSGTINLYNQHIRRRKSVSGYVGVYWHKPSKMWIARVAGMVNGKKTNVWTKTFNNKRDAALARDSNLIRLYGEDILPNALNFPNKYLDLLEEFGHITRESK